MKNCRPYHFTTPFASSALHSPTADWFNQEQNTCAPFVRPCPKRRAPWKPLSLSMIHVVVVVRMTILLLALPTCTLYSHPSIHLSAWVTGSPSSKLTQCHALRWRVMNKLNTLESGHSLSMTLLLTPRPSGRAVVVVSIQLNCSWLYPPITFQPYLFLFTAAADDVKAFILSNRPRDATRTSGWLCGTKPFGLRSSRTIIMRLRAFRKSP